MAKLVFSYSHVDEALRNELEIHLASLKRQGEIETWHDRRILAGQEFIGEIDKNFQEAEIVLLLVSPHFIASDYCFDVEMARALERHEAGEATVIPVILRPCHWHDLPFGKLLAATPDGKPVSQYPSLDDGFYQVVDAIKKAIRARPASAAAVSSSDRTVASLATMRVVPEVRSSNLRVKRAFTDHDRDRARHECFDYVARYFANSLQELEVRNPGIKADFRQLDAQSFEASVYVDGDRVARCGIWLGNESWGGELVYSASGVTRGSFNESMSLDDDGYALGFKPMGMGAFSSHARAGLLGFEGVAEYFWEMLIRPLQH